MCFSMAPFVNKYRAGLYRWLNSNFLTGKIPATLSALTGLLHLCAFFTWIHQLTRFFKPFSFGACPQAFFINIHLNLFALQASLAQQNIGQYPLGAVCLGQIAETVGLYYMDT